MAIAIMFCALVGQSQIVLQLERFNFVKTDKYLDGSYLVYQTKKYPDVWERKYITGIFPELNQITVDGDILRLDEISKVAHENEGVKFLGKKLVQFGIVWFTFAGILELTDRYDFGVDTAAIGATAIGLGIGLNSIFYRKTFTLGKNSRLRILDLNIYNDPFN